jgi:NAD(P)-dependent dehydrogenase (short-subunit alcohol dehydrogenase family)
MGDIKFMDIQELYQSVRTRYPELTGQVAIITGSSKGIGKGIAIRLVKEGMKVVINGRHAEEVEQTTQELRQFGAEVFPVVADVGKKEDVDRLVSETLQAYGSIDLLVNNAASLRRVKFFKVEEKMFDDELAANIKGPWMLSLESAKVMKEKGHGSIIHISSVGGLRAHDPGLPYDATKGALDAMTRVMGIELAEFGIRVNGIAPGAIYTEGRRMPLDDPKWKPYEQLIPLRRMGKPLEIGAVVAFLASEDASYIIGQVIYVDGGITAQLSPSQYQI